MPKEKVLMCDMYASFFSVKVCSFEVVGPSNAPGILNDVDRHHQAQTN